MNILAISAHPDDIEYGCGGTLIRYSQMGHDVFLLVMTKGESGGEPEIRRKEQEESSRIIGIKDIIWGEYKDTNIPLSKDLINKIEDVTEKIKPEVIFVNHRDDTHQDHRNLAYAAISATRYTKNVLFYEVPSTQNFVPTIFVDISTVLEMKLESLKAHSSQITKTNINSINILDLATSTANFRGIQGRVSYSEGFETSRLFLKICKNLSS